MRLFEVGEATEPGCRIHSETYLDDDGNFVDRTFLPVGSPRSDRYIKLRVGRSLREGEDLLSEARLTRDKFGVSCLTKQQRSDDIALVRACIATTPDIEVRYEFSAGAMPIMAGRFNLDPPHDVPMYLIEMRRGSSFRWQRGHDGVVYTWTGTQLIEKRGIELPS